MIENNHKVTHEAEGEQKKQKMHNIYSALIHLAGGTRKVSQLSSALYLNFIYACTQILLQSKITCRL